MEDQYQMSYWERNAFFSAIDVLIIGSGMVGLSAAIFLKEQQPKLNVVILERGSLPIGASTRNAGFACFGSMTELIADLKTQNEDQVWSLVEKRWRGLQRLKNLVGIATMDFQQNGGFELFQEKDRTDFLNCADAIVEFNQKIYEITGQKKALTIVDDALLTLGFQKVEHLIRNRAEGQIDTGKMMKGLLSLARQKGIEIFNGLAVEHLEYNNTGVEVGTTKGWSIKASKMIIATNGFAQNLLPEIKVRPARNQVLITAPVPGLKIKGCFHYDQGYYYFRNIDGRILLGGGRNLDLKGEETDEFGTTAPIQNKLIDMLETVILPGQQVAVENWWSGILGVGDHKRPIVKKLHTNVVVAVRLGGMGIAIGNLIGEEAALLILDS